MPPADVQPGVVEDEAHSRGEEVLLHRLAPLSAAPQREASPEEEVQPGIPDRMEWPPAEVAAHLRREPDRAQKEPETDLEAAGKLGMVGVDEIVGGEAQRELR